jgi:hypothetical protein
LNLYIGLFHIDLPSQRYASPAGRGGAADSNKVVNFDQRKPSRKRQCPPGRM